MIFLYCNYILVFIKMMNYEEVFKIVNIYWYYFVKLMSSLNFGQMKSIFDNGFVVCFIRGFGVFGIFCFLWFMC